jgi:CxxC motif-containing protein (DUF1111 family)
MLSPRVARPMIGLGLLEGIDEADILAAAGMTRAAFEAGHEVMARIDLDSRHLAVPARRDVDGPWYSAARRSSYAEPAGETFRLMLEADRAALLAFLNSL